MAVLFV